MTDIPKPATVADLMKATGLGRDAVRKAIREGQLPGRLISRRYVITRGEFDAFIEGRWQPRPVEPIRPLPSFLKSRKSA